MCHVDIAVVIHPELLCEHSQAVKTYWNEKFGLDTNDFILLSLKNTWQKKVLLLINRMNEEKLITTSNPLRLLSQAACLCATIGDHLYHVSKQRKDNHLQMIMWKMTGFIYRHYDTKITLDDIAAAGAVCRSRCCELFKKYLRQTPNAFLTKYRIAKSCQELRETKRSISEIAISCGFQSSSYFSHVFRHEIGFTPRNYRKRTVA